MTQLANTSSPEQLRDALKSQVVQVYFTKADGTVRLMQATLMESHLPNVTTENSKPHTDTHLFKVWDLDKQAWRSFKWDRLLSWHVSEI